MLPTHPAYYHAAQVGLQLRTSSSLLSACSPPYNSLPPGEPPASLPSACSPPYYHAPHCYYCLLPGGRLQPPYLLPTNIPTTAYHQVGASAQLLGAFCFNVSCVYGLPHMTTTHLQAAA